MIAGLITRFLGFFNRIILARLLGNEGIGIYMLVLPTFFLIITLSQFGLPVAITKLTAEASKAEKHHKIRKIIIISFIIITCTNMIVVSSMYFFIPFLSQFFIKDLRTTLPLYFIIFIVPIISFTSIFKAYFQGLQNMKPQSIALIMEQIVRLAFVYFTVKMMIPFGIEYAVVGAFMSILIGECVSFLYFYIQYKRQSTFKALSRKQLSFDHVKVIIKDLLYIGLPNLGSKSINAMTSFLEPIVIVFCLQIAGFQMNAITRSYGELTGFALPLLLLPTFLTNALSISLVPSIASINDGSKHSIHFRITQAIKISILSGIFPNTLLTLFATPILSHMYGTSNAKTIIIMMAPFCLFLYVQTPLQSALFGLGLAKQAMYNSLIGALIKFILIFSFSSNAQFGIYGVVIAMCTSMVTITFLHLKSLYKSIHYKIPMQLYFKIIVLMVTFFSVTYFTKYILNNSIFILFMKFGFLGIFYFISLLALQLISNEEWRQVLSLFKQKSTS